MPPPEILNLDTHIFLFALAGTLTPQEQKRLSASRWGISGIVIWEIAKLHQKGRINIPLSDAGLEAALGRIHIWPIDQLVCRQIPNLDFRSDPADELIAATSIAHDIPLLTRDDKILASKLVRFA
jgi:PIN domain nuclease of toxin-antitoxin system